MERRPVVDAGWLLIQQRERRMHVGGLQLFRLPDDASDWAIELDPRDVDVLREHQAQQDEERASVGASWDDTGHVFTSPVGGRLHPPDITRWFHDPTDRAGLPRIRLLDLRHSLIKAGVPVKVVTEGLDHPTTAYTQDACQHVMPGKQR